MRTGRSFAVFQTGDRGDFAGELRSVGAVNSAGTEAIVDLVRRHGARGVARQLEVDHKTISKLAAGSSPRPTLRAKIEAVFGIAPKAFDSAPATKPQAGRRKRKPVDVSAPAPQTAAPSSEVKKEEVPELEGPLDSRSELGTMVRQLRKELQRLNDDPKASARERAQVASAVTAAMRLVTKLDGSTSITMAGILRSDHWVKLRGAVIGALAAHPVALADVLEVLRKLAE